MSAALDKAVADHMAHGAGAAFDPLHDSVFDAACAQEGHVAKAAYEEGQAAPKEPWYVGWLLAAAVFVVVCIEALTGDDRYDIDEDAPAGEWVWFPIAIVCVAAAAAFASVFWPLGFAK